MGLVESNEWFFTTTMESKDAVDEYYRVFKAQVDTIEAHGSTPGHHGSLYQERYNAYVVLT